MTTAVKSAVTPKFGGGGEKCKTCLKTVYPLERISYDNGTWHQLCFKCQSCKSSLSLTAVAMISGELYCKTCFKKIFLREGKYSSFDPKTLPKDFKSDATSPPPMSPSPEPAAAATGNTGAELTRAASPAPSPPTRSPSSSFANSGPAAPPTPLAALQLAIEKKDHAAAVSLLSEHGASLLFSPVKAGGATLLEWSLSSYLHKAQGARLLDWLDGRIKEVNGLMQDAAIASPLAGSKPTEEQKPKEKTAEAAETAAAAAPAEADEANPETEVAA